MKRGERKDFDVEDHHYIMVNDESPFPINAGKGMIYLFDGYTKMNLIGVFDTIKQAEEGARRHYQNLMLKKEADNAKIFKKNI